MAGKMKPSLDAGQDVKQVVVLNRAKLLERLDGMMLFVERFEECLPVPFTLFVDVFHVVLLDLRAIEQHDGRKVSRGGSRVNGAFETGLDQRRKVSTVVDVRVGQDHGIDFVAREREFAVLLESDFSFALVQPTVKQDLFPLVVNQVHRSGYRLGRAPELDFHVVLLKNESGE